MSKTAEKSVLTPEHKEFLNDLRDSGVTNMFGASPYVARHFGVPMVEARAILSAWMASFKE